MKPSDLEKYSTMSDSQLENEIPNWKWFKNLSVGDDVIIWLCDCAYFREDLNDFGYTLAKITNVNDDCSVEVDKGNIGKFYYCRHPNEMDACVILIPPTKENLQEQYKQQETNRILKKLSEMEFHWSSLGFEKLKMIMDILEE